MPSMSGYEQLFDTGNCVVGAAAGSVGVFWWERPAGRLFQTGATLVPPNGTTTQKRQRCALFVRRNSVSYTLAFYTLQIRTSTWDRGAGYPAMPRIRSK